MATAAGEAVGGPWGAAGACILTGSVLHKLFDEEAACNGAIKEGAEHLSHAVPHAVNEAGNSVVKAGTDAIADEAWKVFEYPVF
jgi:hypothetical protein